ncbi:MAG: hypothetical protein IJW28_01780 [Clostridia bacterium]|nr:hypothetical protein [Clostridia bacterium]
MANEKMIEFIEKTVNASNKFELTNTELKRQYIISNIILYNAIAHSISECKGTFGTGYPFYALNQDLTGGLPIINEQIRYNNELLEDAKKSSFERWRCLECLKEKGITMENLKVMCKPCPGMDDALKPRKVINRLPDMDLWMVCDADKIETIKDPLQEALQRAGYKTSDVDPVATIYDVLDIAETLQSGKMPKKKLPIDTHLIDGATLYALIYQIPEVLDHSFRHDRIPYLPIHPLSLRKKWQKDDTAYNYVHDFLCSFREFDMDPKIKKLLDEVRQHVAKKYDFDTLYQWTITTGNASVPRRFETPALKEYSRKKFEAWREGDIPANPLKGHDDGRSF